MAEIIESAAQVDPAIAQHAAELHSAMERAGVVLPAQQQTEDPAAIAAAQASAAQQAAIPSFSFDQLKTEFAYEKPEDVVADIRTLRAFKAAPPVTQPTFANDETKAIYDLLQKGEMKPVFDYLEQKQRVDALLSTEVNADTAADIVKFGLKQKYKDLTPAQIDYTFKKQFGYPSKPAKGADEEVEEYNGRVAQWQELVDDKKMELTIEAIKFKPELESAKTKLSLPAIQTSVDQGYLDYKKTVEESAKNAEEAFKAYKAFTPATVETKLPFIDKANGVEFEYQFVPDAPVFTQAQEMASDIEKFFGFFVKADGSADREKFLKFITDGLSSSKMLTLAMDQSKNATLKSMLPDNTQASGLVRQLTHIVEESPLDKEMKARGISRVAGQ